MSSCGLYGRSVRSDLGDPATCAARTASSQVPRFTPHRLSGRIALLAALAFPVIGCRARNVTKATAAAASASASPSGRSLALAAVDGSTASLQQIREIQRHVRARPELDEGWLVLGRAWVRLARETRDPGYYLHAAECAKVLLERAPTHTGALNLEGLVELNQHDFAGAKRTAREILARDPHDVMAWGTLSDAELELGDFEAAVRAVDSMMREKPGLPSYTRTAYLRWLSGDEAGATGAIRLAIDAGDRKDPEPLAWTLVQAATFFWQRGDAAGADAGFDLALEVARDYPPALTGKARVALARGDAARAVELLRRAEGQSPTVETLWLLGDALSASGDKSGSERAFAAAEREGLRGDPRSLSLMDATRNVNLPRALELARAERSKRGDVYTEDALAWALYRNGDLPAARASSDRACRLGTRDAQLWFHRGAILLASGDAAQGRALLRRALAQNPHFDPTAAAEARRLLEMKP